MVPLAPLVASSSEPLQSCGDSHARSAEVKDLMASEKRLLSSCVRPFCCSELSFSPQLELLDDLRELADLRELTDTNER